MRVVLDTNVIVAAALKPDGGCARLVDTYVFGQGSLTRAVAPEGIFEKDDGNVLDGSILHEAPLVVLVDERILEEYREVLLRPKFKLDPDDVDAFLAAIESVAVFIDDASPLEEIDMPDADDAPFLEVAVAGGASMLVTNNLKHFPVAADVEIITPSRLLRLLDDS